MSFKIHCSEYFDRAVECPEEIIDQIGGWSSSDVGEGYGEGFDMKILHKWTKSL